MEVLIKVLQLILSLSLLVFVHELGHYLTARCFGIRVEKFYLFFDAGGFSLFKFKIGDTTFGMGWVPFGGYCKISGMIDESMDTEAMKKPAESWEFRSKPAWQRLIVMVGGVFMNLVTACLIYFGMSLCWDDEWIDNNDLRWGYAFSTLAEEIGFEDGDRVVSFDGKRVEGSYLELYPEMMMDRVKTVGVVRGAAAHEGDLQGEQRVDVAIPEERIEDMLSDVGFMTPRVPFVVEQIHDAAGGESARDAGLRPGDRLIALNGEPMSFFDQFQKAFADASGTSVEVTALRDSMGTMVPRVLNLPVSVDGTIGVYVRTEGAFFPVQTRGYTFWQAIPAGFRKAGEQISSYWDNLKLIFSPKTKAYKQVGSLISIGNIFPAQWDWHRFWAITAFLSIILAVMNILPIPALDGGHVLFLLWEVITRRRPSDKFLEWAQMAGMMLLLALLVLAFWNDIYRFFIKGS